MPHIMRVSVPSARAVCSEQHPLSKSRRKEREAKDGLFIILSSSLTALSCISPQSVGSCVNLVRAICDY